MYICSLIFQLWLIYLSPLGARPQESKGTLIRLPIDLVDGVEATEGWVTKVTEMKDDTLTMSIMSEADSMIGKYELLYETKLKDSKKDFNKQDLDTNVYILFNPWCEGRQSFRQLVFLINI